MNYCRYTRKCQITYKQLNREWHRSPTTVYWRLRHPDRLTTILRSVHVWRPPRITIQLQIIGTRTYTRRTFYRRILVVHTIVSFHAKGSNERPIARVLGAMLLMMSRHTLVFSVWNTIVPSMYVWLICSWIRSVPKSVCATYVVCMPVPAWNLSQPNSYAPSRCQVTRNGCCLPVERLITRRKRNRSGLCVGVAKELLSTFVAPPPRITY